jgi:hypothetical protein
LDLSPGSSRPLLRRRFRRLLGLGLQGLVSGVGLGSVVPRPTSSSGAPR